MAQAVKVARCCFEIFEASSFSRTDKAFEVLRFSVHHALQDERRFEISEVLQFSIALTRRLASPKSSNFSLDLFPSPCQGTKCPSCCMR